MLILRISALSPRSRGCGGVAALRAARLTVECVVTGREALEYCRLYEYDLLLIDAQLPDMSGHEAVRKVRAAGFTTPIMILANGVTARATAAALDAGAADVISARCDPIELLARIRAVIRRSQGHATSALCHGPVEVNLALREVRMNGQNIPLSRVEFGVLELLVLKQNMLLNKAAFLSHLYAGGDEPERKNIEVIVCRLRGKLAAAGAPDLIETMWGSGYILREASALETEGPPCFLPPRDVIAGEASRAVL